MMTSTGLPIAPTADFSERPEDLMCRSCRAASRAAYAHERRRGATPEEAGEALTRDVLAGRAPMLASVREAAARAAKRLVQ